MDSFFDKILRDLKQKGYTDQEIIDEFKPIPNEQRIDQDRQFQQLKVQNNSLMNEINRKNAQILQLQQTILDLNRQLANKTAENEELNHQLGILRGNQQNISCDQNNQ